jgi:hypothetical protein
MFQYGFICHCPACITPAKYPLYADLPQKNSQFYLFWGDDAQYLVNKDAKRAKAKYASYCRYIQERYAKHYPSLEIVTLQMLIIKCLRIFALSEKW